MFLSGHVVKKQRCCQIELGERGGGEVEKNWSYEACYAWWGGDRREKERVKSIEGEGDVFFTGHVKHFLGKSKNGRTRDMT